MQKRVILVVFLSILLLVGLSATALAAGQVNTEKSSSLNFFGKIKQSVNKFFFSVLSVFNPSLKNVQLSPGDVCNSDEECGEGGYCIRVPSSDGYCATEGYQPYCGNGLLDSGEQCDDGNTYDGDGCSSSCIIERSGCYSDSDCVPSDSCTIGTCNNPRPWYAPWLGGECSYSQNPSCSPVCGNGVAEETEQCDGSDLKGNTCSTVGSSSSSQFNGGTLSCNSDCTFDESQCVSSTCGDGTCDSTSEDCNTCSSDCGSCKFCSNPEGTSDDYCSSDEDNSTKRCKIKEGVKNPLEKTEPFEFDYSFSGAEMFGSKSLPSVLAIAQEKITQLKIQFELENNCDPQEGCKQDNRYDSEVNVVPRDLKAQRGQEKCVLSGEMDKPSQVTPYASDDIINQPNCVSKAFASLGEKMGAQGEVCKSYCPVCSCYTNVKVKRLDVVSTEPDKCTAKVQADAYLTCNKVRRSDWYVATPKLTNSFTCTPV